MPNANHTIFEVVLAIREHKQSSIGDKGHFFELPTKHCAKKWYALFSHLSISKFEKKHSFSLDFSERKDYNFIVLFGDIDHLMFY